ncbi:TetR/AcrR family transcriptional regulator [Desulfospira joergensenii]|uniref:TetR/AcrR family transcriptional regulator n=1 Tax=Desulfospira joergensenii TaxID=53329 RepID=UPI0003B4A4CF|nr:TetR family transcriptional regulator [Desulfospira joergensenii]
MPRKTQFTAEEIVKAAFSLVRKGGWEALSVTAVAKKIGSSTMPVYSYFNSLDNLKKAVASKGWELLLEYETKEYTGDPWVDQAIGYVSFAMAEKKLFFCMFDAKNIDLQTQMRKAHWDYLGGLLSGYEGFKGLKLEEVLLIRHTRVMFTHGLATSAIADWGTPLKTEGMLEHNVTAASQAILEGYKTTYNCADKSIAFIDKQIKHLIQKKAEFTKEKTKKP